MSKVKDAINRIIYDEGNSNDLQTLKDNIVEATHMLDEIQREIDMSKDKVKKDPTLYPYLVSALEIQKRINRLRKSLDTEG